VKQQTGAVDDPKGQQQLNRMTRLGKNHVVWLYPILSMIGTFRTFSCLLYILDFGQKLNLRSFVCDNFFWVIPSGFLLIKMNSTRVKCLWGNVRPNIKLLPSVSNVILVVIQTCKSKDWRKALWTKPNTWEF
jgi:hypothetical protein